MVRALFPHAFRGRRLVNRDRFRAGGGQFERIGLPGRRRAARSALLPLPLSPSRARLREAWLRPSASGRALDPLAEPGNDHRAATQRSASTSCVSLSLIDMFGPSRFGSRPIPAPH